MLSPQIVFFTETPHSASKLTPKQFLKPPLPPDFHNLKLKFLQDQPLKITQFSPTKVQLTYTDGAILIDLDEILPLKNYKQSTIRRQKQLILTYETAQTIDFLINEELVESVSFKGILLGDFFIDGKCFVFSQNNSFLTVSGGVEHRVKLSGEVAGMDFDGESYVIFTSSDQILTGRIGCEQCSKWAADSPIAAVFISSFNGIVVCALQNGNVVFSDICGHWLQKIDVNDLLGSKNNITSITGTRNSTILNLLFLIEKSPLLVIKIDISTHRLTVKKFLSAFPQSILNQEQIKVQTLLSLLQFVNPFNSSPAAPNLTLKKISEIVFSEGEQIEQITQPDVNGLRLEVLMRIVLENRYSGAEEDFLTFRRILASLAAQAGKGQFARFLGLNVEFGQLDQFEALRSGQNLVVKEEQKQSIFGDILAGKTSFEGVKDDFLFGDFARLVEAEADKVFGYIE